MMKKSVKSGKSLLLAALGLFFIAVCMGSANAVMQEIDLTNTTNPTLLSSPTMDLPQFVFVSLKYEPYPVNAGEWFDVWIKVQNIGREDATDATFRMISAYPFFIPDDQAVQSFGLIPGLTSESKYLKPGESAGQERQVVLKYRVKAEDNAGEGAYNINFVASPYGEKGRQSTTYTIPITIAKTKTDFDIALQDVSEQGVSFAIANTGGNAATAVTLSIKQPQESIHVAGTTSTILGNLDKGDFTTVTFDISPKGKAVEYVTMNVAYTDTADIRNVVEKNVTVDLREGNQTGFMGARGLAAPASKSVFSKYSNWVYGAAGLILGALIVAFFASRKKNRQK